MKRIIKHLSTKSIKEVKMRRSFKTIVVLAVLLLAAFAGVASAGNQGCTPGYCKNHTGSWPPAGYSPSQTVLSAFSGVIRYPVLMNSTRLQALGFGGGSGDAGAAEILLKAGVAALLNASHPNVSYPRTALEINTDVNNALVQNRDAMLTLAASLDADNNRGCPLH